MIARLKARDRLVHSRQSTAPPITDILSGHVCRFSETKNPIVSQYARMGRCIIKVRSNDPGILRSRVPSRRHHSGYRSEPHLGLWTVDSNTLDLLLRQHYII